MASQVEDRLGDGGEVPYAAYAAAGRMGEQWRAIMLADTGFDDVTVLASPRPQNCIYVCRSEPPTSSGVPVVTPARAADGCDLG